MVGIRGTTSTYLAHVLGDSSDRLEGQQQVTSTLALINILRYVMPLNKRTEVCEDIYLSGHLKGTQQLARIIKWKLTQEC